MDLSDMFSESLKLPFSDYKNWLIFGIITLLSTIFGAYTSGNGIVVLVVAILGLIVELITYGVGLDTMRGAINGSTSIPTIDVTKNIVDGIKSCVVIIIYCIIPAIITLIVAYASGFLGSMMEILANYSATSASVPQTLVTSFELGMGVTVIVGIIVFVIFMLFEIIGLGLLAETGSISAAFNFSEIISKIGSIGWGKYIAFIIIAGVIAVVIGMIGGIIGLIPAIGSYIVALIINSYIILAFNYAIGLLYREA
ncbi:DUF4013 domain-containing protein [Methanosphaera sp.]